MRIIAILSTFVIFSGCAGNYNWGWYAISPFNQLGSTNISFLISGLGFTVSVSIISIFFATLLGLLISIIGLSKLKFVIYEVKNTHHEQHCYVFKINKKNKIKHTAIKKMYVSPFLRSDMRYDFSLNSIFPCIGLKINANNESMQLLTGLKTKEISFSNMGIIKEIFKNLFFSQKIMLLIHFQAIKIFKKGKKFFFKPKKNKDTISFHE